MHIIFGSVVIDPFLQPSRQARCDLQRARAAVLTRLGPCVVC